MYVYRGFSVRKAGRVQIFSIKLYFLEVDEDRWRK
jgi:hypothetical protein